MNILKDKYINPLTDYGFKKLFGTEPNKDLLIDFLNQILPEKHKIEDLSYYNNEQLGLNILERNAIFDIYCIGKSGERFIVEIQKVDQKFFKDRSVYYASFPIQEQAQKGKWDFELKPVYTVGILDFIFDEHKDDDELLHLIELKDQNCELFYDKLKFIYIELPKFVKKESELETHFDKWLYIFRHLAVLQNRPKKLQERIFTKLFKSAEIANFSKKERAAYENSVKVYRDLQNSFDSAEEKGLQKGLQKGIQKGIEQNKIKIAENMKEAGESLEKIQRYTGLSKKQINNL